MNLILITLGLLALAIICWRIMLRVSPEQATGYFVYALFVVAVFFVVAVLPRLTNLA